MEITEEMQESLQQEVDSLRSDLESLRMRDTNRTVGTSISPEERQRVADELRERITRGLEEAGNTQDNNINTYPTPGEVAYNRDVPSAPEPEAEYHTPDVHIGLSEQGIPSHTHVPLESINFAASSLCMTSDYIEEVASESEASDKNPDDYEYTGKPLLSMYMTKSVIGMSDAYRNFNRWLRHVANIEEGTDMSGINFCEYPIIEYACSFYNTGPVFVSGTSQTIKFLDWLLKYEYIKEIDGDNK